MPSKVIVLLIAIIALVGIALSLYTEFIRGIAPCFSCYILRFSYIAIFLLSLVYSKYRRISYFILPISLLIIGVSAWGMLGFLGYQSNPCIESCALPTELGVSYTLFTLALIGGITELILTLILIKRGK